MRWYNLLSQAQLEDIHENSLRIMKEVGILMPDAYSKAVLKKHGAAVEGDIVKFPRELIEKAIRLCPSSYTIYGRDPARNIKIDCEHVAYAGPYGSPFVTDRVRGRRCGTMQDFIEIVKLCDKLNGIDIQSHISCEPTDIEPRFRPTEMVYNTMKYSAKPLMGSVYGYQNAKNCIELASIPFGGPEAIRNKPVIASIPCSLTPLSYDHRQLEAIRAYAEYGQPQLINSLSIAGMTTPVTLAGLVSVQNAEVLAGIVLAQCINPGTPVVYSASGSNGDMQEALLSIGSPEDAVVSLLNGQLAKYYQIPCRISGALSDSKMFDVQAAYESAITLTMAQMAGGNFILHGAGILETYNCTSYEKLIMDNEIIGYLKRIERGVTVDEDSLAYDVIEEVGQQGTFLVEDHTVERFRDEFYMPTLSNRQSYTNWKNQGEKSSQEVCTEKWQKLLAEYGEPTLPAGLDREMRSFMDGLKL